MSDEGKRDPVMQRYVRTPGDMRARRAAREGREGSIWKCPGCGRVLLSPKGLAWHLEAEGPAMGIAACPVAQRYRYGPNQRGAAGPELERFI